MFGIPYIGVRYDQTCPAQTRSANRNQQRLRTSKTGFQIPQSGQHELMSRQLGVIHVPEYMHSPGKLDSQAQAEWGSAARVKAVPDRSSVVTASAVTGRLSR